MEATARAEDDGESAVKLCGTFPGGKCNQKGPDGEKVVSARAIKHVDELAALARGSATAWVDGGGASSNTKAGKAGGGFGDGPEQGERLNAACLFVVTRGDATAFRPNVAACPSFAKHLASAKGDGVRVLAQRVVWGEGTDMGKAFLGGAVDVLLE